MLKHSWIDIAAGLLIAAFGSPMAAGSNARYTVNVWTTDEGLPQNVVMAMTQTRDGYLWLGTLDGLVRFDGIGHAAGAGRTQFAVFGENNTPGLNSSRIFKLFYSAGVVRALRPWMTSGCPVPYPGSANRSTSFLNVCRLARSASLP